MHISPVHWTRSSEFLLYLPVSKNPLSVTPLQPYLLLLLCLTQAARLNVNTEPCVCVSAVFIYSKSTITFAMGLTCPDTDPTHPNRAETRRI